MIKVPKLVATFLFSIFLSSTAFGQTYQQKINEYISQYKELAIAEMLRSGIPASVTLAQGILETAAGQSELYSLANNHFGIKCKSTWTGDYMLHDDDLKNERFRKYNSAEESYKDHSDFLKSRPGYAFLFKLDPTDYEGWARGLKRAGYATSPTYPQQLIKLIVENNLQDYTILALQRANMPDDLFIAGVAVAGNDAPLPSEVSVSHDQKEESAAPVQGAVIAKPVKKYPNSVFNINAAKVIFAKAGASLLALANNFNVSLKKLLEFNELDQTDILPTDQLVFLEKKPKKGSKDVHVAEANESLHDIAQTEGVQLSAIMEYNGLQKGMRVTPGEKIHLK